MKKKLFCFIALAILLCACSGGEDHDGGSVQPITVNAEWMNITVPVGLLPDGEKKQIILNASSNVSWSIQKNSDAGWLTVSPSSGTGGNTITIEASANNTKSKRSTMLTVTGSGRTIRINVEQGVSTGPVSVDLSWIDVTVPLELSPDGEKKQLAVSTASDATWTISKGANSDWLMVTPNSGKGSSFVTIEAQANTTGAERRTTLSIEQGGRTAQVNVVQKASSGPVTIDVDWIGVTMPLELDSEGETKVFSVNTSANGHWTIKKDTGAEWLSVTPMSGVGSSVITVEATLNDTESKRSTTLTISGTGQDLLLIVTQDFKPKAILSSCPDNHHPHAIDLGLPSGTKWACCNIGAKSADDYGGFYAWGETEEKSDFTPSNYFMYQPVEDEEDVDAMDIVAFDFDHVTGRDISGTQYDVAHVKWGGDWRMPTREQEKELENTCKHGRLFVDGQVVGFAFIGPNGNRILFPYSGYKKAGKHENDEVRIYCWTSALYDNAHAHTICALGSLLGLGYKMPVYYGCTVRAVK